MAGSVKIELPREGETLAGKYALKRVVGEGGMGVVYEATHVKLRQRVAIKMLLPQFLDHADVVQRFEREGRMAAKLRDQHVAKVLDVDVTPSGVPYIVMEYLEGRDLDVEVTERGPLPIAEAVDYVLQACAAMSEAHALGIVHRDLKPANLFLCPGVEGPVVKILDFGISKSQSDDDAHLTGTHATVGTPLYMSPEQVRSAKNVDLRSDIWSLGVILFEVLIGTPPFTGSTTGAAAAIVVDPTPSLCERRPEIPPGLEAAVFRALEKDPRRRFPDVQSFAEAIAPFAGRPVPRARSSADLLSSPHLPSPDSSANLGARRASSTLASAATISREETPASVQAASAPRGRSGATAPGWTSARGPVPQKRKALALLALLPIAALALAIGLRTKSPSAPIVTSTGPPAESGPLPPAPPPPLPTPTPTAGTLTAENAAAAPATGSARPLGGGSPQKPAAPRAPSPKPSAAPPHGPTPPPAQAPTGARPIFLP